jgi:DNA-binding NarL/FixJ family response regulator
MTTKLALDLPDDFAKALADKHHSHDLHEAAAHALTIYLHPERAFTERNQAIHDAVNSGIPRGQVAKNFNISLIRVHQIMAKNPSPATE